MLAKLESWDYICMGLVLLGLWLVFGGAKKLAAASPEKVQAGPLLIRGWGAIVVGLGYLVVHFFVLKG